MKSKIYFSFVLGMLLLFATSLNAQVTSGSFSISPFAGYSKFTKDAIVESASTYGGSFGYNFTEYFGLELSYNTIDSEIVPDGVVEPGEDPDGPGPAPAEEGEVIVPGGVDVTGDQYRIEGLFYIYPGNKFAPYAALGIGQLTYDYYGKTYEKMNIPMGFGCKYFITESLALRADFRDVYKLPENNLILSFGVTYQFGGE